MSPARMLTTAAATALLVAAPAALAATKPPAVKKSATYAGTTDQGSVCRAGGANDRPCTITLKTSKDRKLVKSARFTWRAGPCSDNPTRFYRSTTVSTNVRISGRTFKQSTTYQDKSFGDGTTATNKLELNGRFKRSSKGKYSASGDFTVVADIVLPDGTKTHCETGKVRWTAKPVK